MTGTAELGGWAGLAPPTFLEEKCFCLTMRYTLKTLEVPVILHLIQVEFFLEKYLIENVDRLIDCLQSAFSLKIRLVLILSSAIANHDVFYNGCLGFAGSNFAKKNKSPAPS